MPRGPDAFANAQTRKVAYGIVAQGRSRVPRCKEIASMKNDLNPLQQPFMRTRSREIGCATGLLLSMLFTATPANAQQARGELLYSLHCVACHTTEMHWRDKKVATDFETLNFQVRRWQNNAGLGWSESDIRDVTRYLNESIYRYPQQPDPTAQRASPAEGPNRLAGAR